ncbi:hypothetical protein AtDm6_1176 [Acetobacter tropicalis]|uniref:Uncharacterized protein n=2 Tax=Acetobacter tropicalis TaxID=104102 RepID=F7VBR0_9PROT|nr:hypothetical protein AtDm6_1176 [Acetobacter tropicalis]GAA07805.1 hypothetical protein ATPR_0809 [Acetobacter tropicalis NBRC 101654]
MVHLVLSLLKTAVEACKKRSTFCGMRRAYRSRWSINRPGAMGIQAIHAHMGRLSVLGSIPIQHG